MRERIARGPGPSAAAAAPAWVPGERPHLVETLPKTKNGKIMRRAIRARPLGEPAGDLSSLDPATPLEDIPTQEETGAHQ